MKLCKKCGKTKSLDEFYASVGYRCKECHKAAVSEWAKSNPEKIRGYSKSKRRRNPEKQLEYKHRYRAVNPDKVREAEKKYYEKNKTKSREKHLKRTYGLTLDDYNEMLESQGSRCDICGQPPSEDRALSVDHDHGCCPGEKSCGECVRSLLCGKCNSLLGYAADSLDILESAVEYVKRWKNEDRSSMSKLRVESDG